MSDKPTARAPLVFISYSHDSKPHKEWVAGFALRLREKGVEVLFDQFDIGPGDDVPKFMERAVSEADHVLMVCTETYVRKADDGKGGVGYEAMVVTGELIRDLGTSKFIPVIRQSGPDKPIPRCVSTRFYVDLSEGADIEEEFEKLLRKIHQVPKLKKPPLGTNPFAEETFKSAASLARKQDRRLEFSDALASPDAAYERALDIIHAKDRVAWRRLLLAADEQSNRNLTARKEENSGRFDCSNDEERAEFLSYAREGVECYGPFIAVLVAAAESGEDEYAGQLGWTDTILSPGGWNTEGLSYWVRFPEVVFFIAQALVGGMLMESGLGESTYQLASAKFRTFYNSKLENLFSNTDLNGWVKVLGGNCAMGWQFLDSVIENWSWLGAAFGNRTQCRGAISGYYLLMNFLNFVTASRDQAWLDGKLLFPVTAPLSFLQWPAEPVQRGYQLFIKQSVLLNRILQTNKLDHSAFETLWPKWMEETGKWFRGGYPFNWGNWHLPHAKLPEDLRRDPYALV